MNEKPRFEEYWGDGQIKSQMMVNAVTKQKSREERLGVCKFNTSVRDTFIEELAEGSQEEARQQAHRHGHKPQKETHGSRGPARLPVWLELST